MPRDNVQENSLTPRHEAFCQYFVLGGNATYAARDAGFAPKSSKNQGYRLMRRARIRARVAEIRSELAATFALDARVLLGKLEALYLPAIEDHHFHAAARCVELQARMAGHVEGRFKVATVPGTAAGMTTNDDIHGPFAAPKPAQSTG